MSPETYDLLNSIPDGADYAVAAGDLDPEDIPQKRVDAVLDLLRTTSDIEERFQAAKLLTSWGIHDGLDALEVIMGKPEDIQGFYTHRLHGYDDTYRQILMAITSYFANVADRGEIDAARAQVYAPLAKIILLANKLPFEITGIFDFAKSGGFSEYLPLVEEHLTSIIDQPNLHGWKIYDAIQFLIGFDSKVVMFLLSERNKTVDDFKPKAQV
ncbi:hypothetical protein IAI51_25550 [Pseudomonas sp. N40(2020)]|uniref:hypothetical protein n=1 Tax=Pseudomonas sp. N40(2020) TaxID=2767798 RepID=UPI001656AC8C|nr:hypothetical protein [Pseudomonas sp. N40(2020)]MBC8999896.1 hypothetical protein [Pseudomonas sp. N40(2020)]